MIKLIVTTSGYVESSYMTSIFWRLMLPWRGKEDVTKALSPKRVLFSLANELANEYRRAHLIPKGFYENHSGHTYEINRYDLSINKCPKCDSPIRDEFLPEDFQDWLYEMNAAIADGGPGELDHWWPWDSYSQIHAYNFKPKETILVESSFEILATASVIIDETFSSDEKPLWSMYIENNPYKVIQNEDDKFWRAERIYSNLDDDPNEAVNPSIY